MTNQENRRGIIYKAVNQINGKCYIGKTVDSLKERQRCHHREINKNKLNTHFVRALKKYGKEKFEWFIIGYIDKDINNKLSELEIYYIKKYNSIKNGYNMTEGGEGIMGYHFFCKKSEEEILEYKNKLSKIHKKRLKKNGHHNKGKKWTEEHKRKIGEASKKMWLNQEIRDKQSESHKGIIRSKKWKNNLSKALMGHKHSEETKNKISEKAKGRKVSIETRNKMSVSQLKRYGKI